MSKKPNGYVLYIYVSLQDGYEESAKCFSTIEDAVNYINKDRWPGDQYTFRLFELGKEIKLIPFTEKEPQPSKVKTVYKVRKQG